MKLLFLVNNINGKGGVEKVLSTLVNNLNSDKFQIEVMSVLSTKEEPSLYSYNENIKLHHLGMVNICNKRFISELSNTYSKNNIDYVIALSSTLVSIATVLKIISKNISKPKIVAWEHSQYSNISFFKKIIRRLLYPLVDYVISQTKTDTTLFENDGCNALTIPNPIKLKKEITRAEITKTNRIIAIGRLEYEKGFDILIKMIGENKTIFKNWKVDIYGEGSQKRTLLNLINDYQIENIVELKKFESNLYDKISDYDILVSTSRSESFSMVILEGLSCSLPVIAFDCPSGPREIIDDSINGYLVPCFNEDAFINKAKELMINSELRIKMGTNGKLKSRDYSIEKIIEHWERVLK